MKRLFLIALALVVLLVTPVCAYDLVYTDTGSGLTASSGITYIGVWENMSITRVEATLVGYCAGACRTSGTYSDVLGDAEHAGNYGTYNATWTGLDAAFPYETFDVTIDLDVTSYHDTGYTLWYLTGLYDYIKNGGAFETYRSTCTEPVTVPYGTIGGTQTAGDPPLFYYGCSSNGTAEFYSGTLVTAPVASFTCTPTSQFPDTDVVCTDTSTNVPTDWYWSIDAEALGIKGWKTNTAQNFTWQSAYPGLYSVNLRANNSAGSDWENKTNYVSISENATPNNCNIPPLAGLVRSWAQCVDSQTSGAVAGCDLSLYDLEGGAWSNITDRFDGTWCIDTYPGHHFNAYGSAEGYTPDPTYRLNLPVSSSVVYELLMHPGYVPPAVEGKVWVYGIVNDADTGAAIEGAVFRLDASGQTPKSDTTDAAGSMHIQWVNKTQTTATASKPGYGTISKVFTTSDFGPDTVRIEIHRSIVTPTPTATTGPGGTVPTTVNPNGPNNGVYPSDYTNTQGQAIMNLLAYHGYDLVLLCIFVTMLALLGFKLGGR